MSAISTTTPVPDAAAVEAFAQRLRGRLVRSDDAGYDDARKVYNAMIDRRPALIAYCADAADVSYGVSFAREHGMLLAVRGGGHSGPGLGVCDGGLVLDLSAMNGVHVDAEARVARVEGGCTLGDVDHATHVHGLATPLGIISTAGVGGLVTGGGIGYLARRHGLSIDNLLEADVVLADASLVTAGPDRNQDLFWAIRGGGGNFGVVTSFTFRLHPVGTVCGGPMLWTLDRAADVLRWYRDFLPSAPEDLNGFFAFVDVPPMAPFPEPLHGQTVCGVVWTYLGPIERAAEVFGPIRERFGPPAVDLVGPLPFPALQSIFDALFPPGLQWYWKGDFFEEIPDEAIARHVTHGSRNPTNFSTMHLYPIDGAAARVDRSATAWSYRGAKWAGVIAGVSPDASDAGRITTWAREYWEALHPYSAGGAYVNFMMEEGSERVRATYREHYHRLSSIKAKYDPTNLFRVNQNIMPRTR